MFKDPIASKEANDQAEKLVIRKMKEISKEVSDPDISDTEFTRNLFDLCLLNKMVESHQK